ncbi:MAG: hypothetical protein ABJN61_11660 [Flavobacteriaceae bacterium]
MGLLTALLGYLMSFKDSIEDPESLIYFGLWVSETAGFLMLLRNGTFIKTKYFNYLKGLFSFVLIGALFRILHWDYSYVFIIIGFVGFIIVYFISFLKKPRHLKLDYMKLLWVIAAYTTGLLEYFHMIGDDYKIISSAIMWIAIIEYVRLERKAGRIFT